MAGAETETARDEGVRYCATHPDVETVVSCGRCDRPVCPKCMIFTPVGVRCRDCAQLRRLPQYTITLRVYARIIPGAVALALGVGFLLSLVPGVGFLGGIMVGFLVSEGLRRVSGYKQGREMEVIAAATVILSVLAGNVFSIVRYAGLSQLGRAIQVTLSTQSLAFSALGIAIGIYIAVQRLR